MATSEPTSTLEQMEDHSLRWQARFYVERLAFTQRGRFALIVGVLLVVYSRVGTLLTEGVPSASRPLAAAQTQTAVKQLLTVAEGSLVVVSAVTAGVVVLLVLDVYEHEFGTLVDIEEPDDI